MKKVRLYLDSKLFGDLANKHGKSMHEKMLYNELITAYEKTLRDENKRNHSLRITDDP